MRGVPERSPEEVINAVVYKFDPRTVVVQTMSQDFR
ncbi:hypothetical protein RCH23_002017 [Cryobacterium sp. CAN_C3]|nr:hypothetical protein [Cryobacterium sp. CAN_C3]